MHGIVCTVVPKACRSCCDLLILIQLLCRHFEVKSLIMTCQVHSFLLAVDSLSLSSDFISASAQNRLNQQWKVAYFILKFPRESVQGQLRVWTEFHSRLKIVSGKNCELILKAIIHYQTAPASPLGVTDHNHGYILQGLQGCPDRHGFKCFFSYLV